MRRLVLVIALAFGLCPPAQAAVAPARQISADRFGPNVAGQHSTQAEPDSFAFGNTVVATFQVGRFVNGGAAAIGWATSLDGGQTWADGILPAQTPFTEPKGPWSRVSDPVVAYDRVHNTWLISVLGISDARGGVPGPSGIITFRSTDGLNWSPPVTTSPSMGSFVHDKNWIVCDNGSASRFAGRCYTLWMDVPTESLVASTSLDGGATWGAPVPLPGAAGNGAQPVPLPDGTLVVPFLVHEGAIASMRSRDGGATFTDLVQIAEVTQTPNSGIRAPALPSAEAGGDGRVYLVWHSCNDLSGCFQGQGSLAPKGIIFTSSADGVAWTAPRRLPLGPVETGQRLIPGLGADPNARGRLALTYYLVSPFGCLGPPCSVRTFAATSGDGGATWSAPAEISPRPMSTEWIADATGGKMVGDYISTSFVTNGVAVAVFVAAFPPVGDLLQQATYAVLVPPLAPLRLEVAGFRAQRTRTQAVAMMRVRGSTTRAQLQCAATSNGRTLRVAARSIAAEVAVCRWQLPKRKGAIRGRMTLRSSAGVVTRTFVLR